MQSLLSRSEIRIPAIFAVLAATWIVASDSVVILFFPELQLQHQLQTAKGLFFITAVTVVLFLLIRRDIRRDQERVREIGKLIAIQTSIFAGMRRSFIAVDIEWNITLCNQAALELLRRRQDSEVEGRRVWGLLPAAMVHVLRDLAVSVGENSMDGRSGTAEHEMNLGPGEWWHVQLIPFPDGMGIFLDNISDRKNAALREEELIRERAETLARLQMHIDRLPIGYIITDAEFRFQYLNPTAERIYGFSSGELHGKKPYGIIIPESMRAYIDEKRSQWQRGDHSANGTTMNLTKDRGAIYCEWFNTPILSDDGEFQYLISMIQDVTERVNAEDELRRSEERFRVLIERASEGILTIDHSRFTSCNQKAADILGMTIEDIVGHTPQELSPEFQPNDIRSADLATMYTDRALAGEVLVFEWVHFRADGGTTTIEVSLGRVQFEDEPSLLCFWRDITERKAVEGHLRSSREKLRALTARLDAVREEERKELSRELHDGLGQILTALKIDIALLKRLLTSSNAPTEQIETAVSMNSLVDDSLHMTRSLARDLRPALLEETGLGHALETLLSEMSAKAGLVNEIVLPEEAIRLDHAQVLACYRIAQEALTNIIRHASASKVSVRLVSAADETVMEIDDDGIGIESQSHWRPGALGIAGMRERVEQFNGRLHVHALPGKGTRVCATFPSALADNGEGGVSTP